MVVFMPTDFAFKVSLESFLIKTSIVGSVIEWLKRQDCDRYGLNSKLTRTHSVYLWERHLTEHSHCLVVLANISKF